MLMWWWWQVGCGFSTGSLLLRDAGPLLPMCHTQHAAVLDMYPTAISALCVDCLARDLHHLAQCVQQPSWRFPVLFSCALSQALPSPQRFSLLSDSPLISPSSPCLTQSLYFVPDRTSYISSLEWLFSSCWNSRHTSPCLIYPVLGRKPVASRKLEKHSAH